MLCEQGNKADRMAGHIGHFRGNGFAASDIVDLIDDGEAIIERVGVKQFCVRCKWHGMRCNIAAAQALQKGLPVFARFRFFSASLSSQEPVVQTKRLDPSALSSLAIETALGMNSSRYL